MNGLEAIELMKQGKMVIRISTQILYRLQDGVLEGCDHAGTWKSNWLFDFNAEYEEYIEPKPLTGWERVNRNDIHYVIGDECQLDYWSEKNVDVNKNNFEKANYFSTEEKADEINFKQTLFRKLQRFSDENGGDEIDWTNADERKLRIFYDYEDGTFEVEGDYSFRDLGQVYFSTEDVARKAIELFHDDLIKYFTM